MFTLPLPRRKYKMGNTDAMAIICITLLTSHLPCVTFVGQAFLVRLCIINSKDCRSCGLFYMLFIHFLKWTNETMDNICQNYLLQNKVHTQNLLKQTSMFTTPLMTYECDNKYGCSSFPVVEIFHKNWRQVLNTLSIMGQN